MLRNAGNCARTPLRACLAVGLLWCVVAFADPGTPEDRAALFDYLLRATMERTAFSPSAPRNIGAGEDVTMAEYVRREMVGYRDEMVRADTDEKLYEVLSKISNTRWDSHVEGVGLVPGGISPVAGVGERRHAPIKFKPDYTDSDAIFLFVSDFSKDFAKYAERRPRIGDRLVAVNHTGVDDYFVRFRRYFGRSTRNALWWAMASAIVEKSNRVPDSLHDGQRITLELQPRRGLPYTVALPYVEYDEIAWMGFDDHYVGAELSDHLSADPGFHRGDAQYDINSRRYRGFELFSSSPAFDIYLSRTLEIVLLKQHRFVPEFVVADLDRLLDHARIHGLLDAAVIFDITLGRGGDFEEYALQRLQPKPFKMIFGNLRISDIPPALADQLRATALESTAAAAGPAPARLAQEVDRPDSGGFLLDWLDNDLASAIRQRQAYGEVMEGNPAQPAILLPLTRDNYLEYYDLLMRNAVAYIERVRMTGKRSATRLERITDGRMN